jgi:hypothetical protein
MLFVDTRRVIDTLLVPLGFDRWQSIRPGGGLLHPEYRGRRQRRVCAKSTGDSTKEADRTKIEPVDGDQRASRACE